MAHFRKEGALGDFQELAKEVYGLPDDRLFSLSDLISNMERFTMRALKGIRKDDHEKLSYNLCIAFAWSMSLANRLHFDAEQVLWRRFPYVCSYCAQCPCMCKKVKLKRRTTASRRHSLKPKSLKGFQVMFEEIYPTRLRGLFHAGVHLAEETGELSEVIHYFIGGHQAKKFEEIQHEYADYLSCIFGVANSAHLSLADELALLFKKNCHICHKAPCTCTFSFISEFQS